VDLPIRFDFFHRCPVGPFSSNGSLDGPQTLRGSKVGDRIISLQTNNKVLVIIYGKTEINET
jgi:hypothetical protein